jgi:hypothetical protein
MTSCQTRLARAAFVVAIALTLNACTSSPRISGVPSNLPTINLKGSARTPSHGMARADYPFDSNGDYVTAWAAEGSSSAGPSDYRSSSPRRSGRSSSRKPTSSTKKATASKSSGSSSRRHTVKSGDSLWSIARKYGSSVAKIKSANGLKSDSIRDGRSLIIPR